MPIDVVENFIARGANDKGSSTQLLRWLKDRIKEGHVDLAADVLPRLLVPGLDYTTTVSLCRVLRSIRGTRSSPNQGPKIAVLGSVTTHQLVEFLDLHLQSGRIDAEFYEADYGTINQEFLDPTSGLRRFHPDFILIFTSWRDLKSRPSLTDGSDEVGRRIDAEVASWSKLWKVAREDLRCQVIQSNFAAPPWRALGNLDAHHPAGLSRFISLVNQALVDRAPPGVTIHDVDRLAAESGRWEWSDERFFYQAKLPCSPEQLVDYSHSLAALLLAQLGAGRKCLVLDLDNTLWGGVIGDDGLGGIRLGQGEPESEAFVAFQGYVKSLADRGILLAVCSKNDEKIAREVFEKHPEMVLRLEDVSCFVANWDDKPANLARIAERLNIGLNSLVFFDDNPAERSIVRRLQPEVAVPEVPEDPSYRIRALDRHRYFEALAISREDLQRRDFYRANSERQALESSVESLDDFLRSLEMQARIEPVGALNVERTVQLINRSNQFNLTTKRYTNADVLEFANNPAWITLTVSLKDRFGDNGLISVLLARVESDSLVIDTWLMSCRVLKRGVEALLLNCVFAAAKKRGLNRLVGDYLPTAKNDLVREHYPTLGFARIGSLTDGQTQWELRVDEQWKVRLHFIKEIESDEPIAV
ncbi:MAG: HAD-IIIC family phosphatase [Steroidobacteraceae bacterium]|jgi:FkbH-like protein